MTCEEYKKENEMLKELLLHMIIENTQLEMELSEVKETLNSSIFDKNFKESFDNLPKL